MTNTIAFFVSAAMLIASCGSSGNNPGIVNSNAAQFDSLINAMPDEQLVDVRTPEEFAGGHLMGAQNIDWNNSDFSINVGALDKTKPVLVYCRSGSRSHEAAEFLSKNGFTTIYELNGGITAWESAGKPTEQAGTVTNTESGVTLEQYNKFIADNKVVLVDFTAVWCGPCKLLSPSLHELEQEIPEKFKLLKVDVDRDRPVAEHMNIAAMPTLILYKDGQIVWRNEGLVPKDLVLEKINSVQ